MIIAPAAWWWNAWGALLPADDEPQLGDPRRWARIDRHLIAALRRFRGEA